MSSIDLSWDAVSQLVRIDETKGSLGMFVSGWDTAQLVGDFILGAPD